MRDEMDRLQVYGAGMYGDPCTLEEYQVQCRAYLEELREIHPIFRRLSVLGVRDFDTIADDLSNLGQKIVEVVSRGTKGHDCINEDSSESIGPRTINRIGFSATFFSHDSTSRAHVPLNKGGIELTVRGVSAGTDRSGSAMMFLPTDNFMELHSSEKVRRLLHLTLERGGYSVGAVRSMLFERAVQEKGDLYSGYWLLYLPFPYLAECLPPDIHWEPFHNGILIQTTPHPPNADDPADVAAGKRVREVLDQFGLAWQSTYAIHGWPPDEEEWRYEEFITGAPSGRKYRVHCIDFDGYDPQRKVLLYAKLFRRLRRQPRQWGLRGWDGPVINEARRQVRAANGEPIEWHIGLEEPADRVRTLLADHTDITESQLKVIHTPLELALRREVTPKEFPA